MKASQGFEADSVTVEATVRSPEELLEAAERLVVMARNPALPKVLHLAGDDGDGQ